MLIGVCPSTALSGIGAETLFCQIKAFELPLLHADCPLSAEMRQKSHFYSWHLPQSLSSAIISPLTAGVTPIICNFGGLVPTAAYSTYPCTMSGWNKSTPPIFSKMKRCVPEISWLFFPTEMVELTIKLSPITRQIQDVFIKMLISQQQWSVWPRHWESLRRRG